MAPFLVSLIPSPPSPSPSPAVFQPKQNQSFNDDENVQFTTTTPTGTTTDIATIDITLIFDSNTNTKSDLHPIISTTTTAATPITTTATTTIVLTLDDIYWYCLLLLLSFILIRFYCIYVYPYLCASPSGGRRVWHCHDYYHHFSSALPSPSIPPSITTKSSTSVLTNYHQNYHRSNWNGGHHHHRYHRRFSSSSSSSSSSSTLPSTNHHHGIISSSNNRHNNRTAVITGGNEGIGADLAHHLTLYYGIRIVLLVRNMEKASRLAAMLYAQNPSAEIVLHHVDLCSPTSIRIAVNEILSTEHRIDLLLHCASIAYLPRRCVTVDDGHEQQLATNYFAPFLLTHLLLDRMRNTAAQYTGGTVVKVIHLGSGMHRFGTIPLDELNAKINESQQKNPTTPITPYNPLHAYGSSKLATLLVSREWARRMKPYRIHFYTVDPGVTRTNSAHYQHLPPWIRYTIYPFIRLFYAHSTTVAVRRVLCCIMNTDGMMDHQTGYYYSGGDNCGINDTTTVTIHQPSTPLAMDDRLARTLWNVTMKVCGIDDDNDGGVDDDDGQEEMEEEEEEKTEKGEKDFKIYPNVEEEEQEDKDKDKDQTDNNNDDLV